MKISFFGHHDYKPDEKDKDAIIAKLTELVDYNPCEFLLGGIGAFDMVKEAMKVKLGKITKSDIMALCPSLSRSAVEKALRDLIATGFISKHGSDPATFYLLEK